MLTGYLKNGTEYLSASTVRRVIQVASMSVVGSAIAVSRLTKRCGESRRRTRMRIRSRWLTTWCGCEQELCIQARTQIPCLRGVRQVRSWLMN